MCDFFIETLVSYFEFLIKKYMYTDYKDELYDQHKLVDFGTAIN